MNCDAVRTRAPLWLSGEMEESERERFAAHLSTCAACESEIEQQAALDARLAVAFGCESPETSRINHTVRRHIALSGSRRRWLAGGAVAAALGILGLGLIAQTPQLYAAAARDHQIEVVENQPRHWRSGAADIEALTSRIGLSYAQAAALAPAGYTLDRAKFCGLDGKRVLHLVFSGDARTVSVYVRPHAASKAGIRLVTLGSERVGGFETGRFTTMVVTTGSPLRCEDFARWTAGRL